MDPKVVDHILSYVLAFGDDQGEFVLSRSPSLANTDESSSIETVTTLHSTLLVCHSFHGPSLRALYYDPSRSHAEIKFANASQLLKTLQTKSTLANLVTNLSHFDKCHEKLAGQAQGELEKEAVEKWAVQMLLACKQVERVTSFVEFNKSVSLATSTINTLENLKYLTIRGPPERRVQVLKVAQAFITGLHLKQGRLVSLRVTGFNHKSWFASDDIPIPEGGYSSLQVEKLEFNGNDHDVAWSPLFLPIEPSLLRTLSYESYMEHKIEATALEELAGKTEGSLEIFVFRGQSMEPGAIIGSLHNYEEIWEIGTVFFPAEIFKHNFVHLTQLILEGIHFLQLALLQSISNYPHLATISFYNSIWYPHEWKEVKNTCDSVIEIIQTFQSLRTLHLGHLPLLASDQAMATVLESCQGLEINFDWQPCLEGRSAWEEEQLLLGEKE